MKGWVKRAQTTTKPCRECGKAYKPKMRWTGHYESENHFMNSKCCSKKCQDKRYGRLRTKQADQKRAEKKALERAYDKAVKLFLYPGAV